MRFKEDKMKQVSVTDLWNFALALAKEMDKEALFESEQLALRASPAEATRVTAFAQTVSAIGILGSAVLMARSVREMRRQALAGSRDVPA